MIRTFEAVRRAALVVLTVLSAGCVTAPAPAVAPASTPAATVASRPPGMPDLARARPEIHAFSAEEIDRVSGRSGLTDCFWVGTVSPTTFNILIPDSGLVYWLTQFRLPAGAR